MDVILAVALVLILSAAMLTVIEQTENQRRYIQRLERANMMGINEMEKGKALETKNRYNSSTKKDEFFIEKSFEPILVYDTQLVLYKVVVTDKDRIHLVLETYLFP